MAAGLTQTANEKGRLLPGLHKLDVERDWLLHAPATFSEHLRLKHHALDASREATLRSADATHGGDSLPAQREVLDMVLEHLPRRFPRSFSLDGRRLRVHVEGAGCEYDVDEWREMRPLELAGLLLQEDLVLMRAEPGGAHRVQAAFVVFSFGRVLERVGMDLEQVHADVNRFPSDLRKPVGRFFDKLSASAPAWRTNFGLTWSPSLVPTPDRYPHRASYAPEATHNTPGKWMMARIGEVGVGRAVWLKVEYQTVRRLRGASDHALFTVRTYVDPLHTLLHVPAAARLLAQNMRNAAQGDFKHYLGIDDEEVRGAILAYLDSMHESGGGGGGPRAQQATR